jgi:hypothetical protein
MADYAISNVPRRVVYAASGTGPYAFTFEILNQTDIAVYKASTLLTLTTDYTVTINANGTGSVTLVTTAGTSNITIVGAKNIQRTTDFTTGGDLFANTLNDELDNQTIFIQQVAETAERGLKAPVVDPTDINMTLPAKASRVGTVLAFNATTGNPEAGPSIASVTTVAAQSANINTVATNIASVNTVAGNNTNINTVAGVSGNVTTVAGSIANVNTVADDLNEGVSEINTVAVNIADVNSVGTNISNVNTVAGISANVTSVAGNASNINTVAGNNGNVTTVAGISGNVTTVAGISANVTTVAGINAAVSTVATNNANVSTVATNIAAVNTNATNIVAIQNASTNATNAATSATAAQTAQSAAESARDATLAAYDNFDDRYLGSKTSNPTLDNDGNALAAGALYFNSVSGAMQVYTGSAWVAAYVSGTGFLASANNLSDVASTSSARTNLGLGTIATQTASSVAITGGAIDGTTVGATTASTGRFSDLTDTGLTSGRVIYAGTGGNLVDDADFTFNGTTVTMANDASISGLTVGKGGGAFATNTAVGASALSSATTGGDVSTAIGYQALAAATTSGANTAVGYRALYVTTTGSGNNTAVGTLALTANTTGAFNEAIGRSALGGNTTGSNNVAMGTQSLTSNTTASNNTAVGYQALYANTTGDTLTAVGYRALDANTTGFNSVAVGNNALGANTTGNYNVAMGDTALFSNTTASNNTAVGYQAGYSNTTGGVTAFGQSALRTNTTGLGNVGLGNSAGYSMASNNYSTYVGHFTGYNTTGGGNTFIGNAGSDGSAGCGFYMTTGANNTIIGGYTGNQGGLDIRTASNYIVLSDGLGNPRIIVDNNGKVLIGGTSAEPQDNSGVDGIALTNTTGAYAQFAVNNKAVAAFNRLSSDGTIVSLRQAGIEEGTISVSGTTVSYNGGHLSRWSQLPDNSKDDTILKGTVLTNLDDMCVWTKDGTVLDNEQLNKMKVSDVEGDTNVAGVFVNWTFDEQCQSEDMNIAMTGDMIIRIADGVVVQKGDLLMSAGDGTAKPQGDDIVRSKTIAKVTSNYVTCTYADGSYCVPCVLMAC